MEIKDHLKKPFSLMYLKGRTSNAHLRLTSDAPNHPLVKVLLELNGKTLINTALKRNVSGSNLEKELDKYIRQFDLIFETKV